MRPERRLYEILQVDPRAEPEILEAAYRRLARKYHPDVSTVTTADQRMKEINTAYEVLRDPLRRAAYDRAVLEQLDEAGHRDGDELEEAEHWEPGGHMLACRLHPDAVAVGTCGECGAGLCGRCFDRFQPPSCGPCLLAWTSQRRRELWLPAIWFFGIVGITTYLFATNVEAVRQSTPLLMWALALFGYLVASFPTGWRVLREVEADGEDPLLAFAFAAVAGPILAPFRMGKIVWDLRQLGRLESIARGA